MPTYDYVCANCGHRFEVIHGVDAAGPEECPVCHSGPARKGFAPPTIHFKGSGWAKMDRGAARRSKAAERDGGVAAPAAGGAAGSSAGGPESEGSSGGGSKTEGSSTSGSGSEGSSGSDASGTSKGSKAAPSAGSGAAATD